MFVSIIVISSVLQVIIVQYFGQGASVAVLSSEQWLVSVGIAAITLPWGIAVKLFPAPEKGVFQIYAESMGYTSGIVMASLEKRVVDLEGEIETLKAKLSKVLSLDFSNEDSKV